MTFRDRPAVRRAGHAALTSTKVPKAFPGFIWTDRPEWGLRMDLRFRVYVSPPLPSSLTLQQQQIMEAVLHKLDASGFRPRGYYAPGLDEGVPSRGGMHELMAMCQGTVVLGFRRGQTSIAGQQGGSVTEYSHIEGGIAIALGKPLLVLREAGMVRRGIVLEGGRRSIVDIPPALPADGLDSIPFFPERYAHWEQQLNQHRHAFLGYCSQSHAIAAEVARRLRDRGVTLIGSLTSATGDTSCRRSSERPVRPSAASFS